MIRLVSLAIVFLCPALVYGGAVYQELLDNNKIVRMEWETPHIRWRFNTSNAPENAKELIEQSFDTWANVSGASVTHEYAGISDADEPTVDGFSDIFFGLSPTYLSLPAGVVAITLRNSISDPILVGLGDASDAVISEADLILNSDETFALEASNDPTNLDIVEVITHELGHAYGLAHTFLLDSMMYPAKPTADTPASLRNLFRAPKRSLAQDDRAWLSFLYPAEGIREQTAEIHGQVFYEGRPYVGAHVVAIKQGESDASIESYTDEDASEYFLPKGLMNVSAFSGEGGRFEIRGLEPGDYSLFLQTSNPFLCASDRCLGLGSVNGFLDSNFSRQTYPNQMWESPDCQSYALVDDATLASLLDESSVASLAAGDALCQVEMEAHIGGQVCGARAGVLKNSCNRASGFCSLEPRMTVVAYLESHPGLVLIILGSLMIIYSARSLGRKIRK